MGKKSLRKAAKLAAKQNQVSTQLFIPPKALRPFSDFKDEAQLVAMRELLPAATLELKTTQNYGTKTVLICTLVPELAQGVVRADGVIMLSMQNSTRSNDAAHDLAVVLEKLIDAEPGTVIKGLDVRCHAPKLSEMLQTKSGKFTLHEDFSFWVPDTSDIDPQVKAALAETKENLVPMIDLGDKHDLFWCSMADEQFIRWVMVEDEDTAYDALARLRATDQLNLASADFIGVFRGLGVVAPVWRLKENLAPEAVDQLLPETDEIRKKFKEALKSTDSLGADERAARRAIVSRQVSLN